MTEKPKPDWNPRYLMYAAAHGHKDDPDGMLKEDEQTWKGGSMTGFILWIAAGKRAFHQKHRCGCPVEIIVNSHPEAFDAFLATWPGPQEVGGFVTMAPTQPAEQGH